MTDYVLRLIKNGEVSGFVEDRFNDLTEAVNWTFFFLGLYHCDGAQIFHADDEQKALAEIQVPPEVYRMHFNGPQHV